MSELKSCEHLNRLVDVLLKEPWLREKDASCHDCGCPGPNLWLCLHEDCFQIGCSENNNDHSTYHFKAAMIHCVHMNMTTRRVWCYRCNREVFPKAALANAALKAEAYHNSQLESGQGLKGAGEHLRSNSLICLERGPGLNVGSPQDSQESSDCDDEDSLHHCNTDVKPRGLVGLQNIGNTCYMNSAIQALSNTPPLTQYFLDCAAAVDFLTDTKKPGLSRSYQKLVREIWNKRTRGYVVPNGILYGIRNVHPMFRGYHQHDTQEFLRCFMDQLHEELKEPVREHQEPPYITRQPKQASDSHLSRNCDINRSRRTFRARQSPVRSAENSISSSKGYYRVHSQSECSSSGVGSLPPGHRRSASYCPLPQDISKDEFGTPPPPQTWGEAETEGEGEGEEEEESYETCDSGVSDSAELSGEEGHSARRKIETEIVDRLTASMDTNTSPPGTSDAASASSSATVGGGGDRVPPARYRSVISDVFDGRLLSSVQCLTCDRISTRVETFQDLSLPIPSRDHVAVLHGGGGGGSPTTPSGGSTPRGAACSDAVYSATQAQEGWMWWILSWLRSWFYGPAVTLYDCLAAFFSADELKGDNMYSCEKCNKLRNGIKYSKVLGLPEVLCVHLKRFRHELMSSTKIGAKVSFPLSGLDMRPYLHKDCASAIWTYELVAVICHAGTAGGGHYTCVARNCYTDRWFQFDDQYVSSYTPQQVANCEAYVLFYKKWNPRMASLRQKAIELQEATNELNDIKFYISKQWINRFNTYAEPGPIDNGDFLCEHGGVVPDRLAVVERLTTEISQPLWEFFYQNFGGGPACNQLHACAVCRAAAERLKRRQAHELQRFTFHNNFTEQKAVYAISMNWFRSWQTFAHSKTQQPPPPIDNSSIVMKSSSQENASGRSSSPKQAMIKPGSDYAQINEDCWRFFHSIYGGGPEVKLKSAPNYTQTTPRSNTISYTSQGYNSGSETYTQSYNKYNSLPKSRNPENNYEQLVDKHSDSEDNSIVVDHSNVKSLSNVDLFNVANRNGDINCASVKGTQSLQDVSLHANNVSIESQNSHRMSVDSDSHASLDNSTKRYPLVKSANVTSAKANGKKSSIPKTSNNTRQNNSKQKGGKGSRKRSNRGSDSLRSNSSCEENLVIGDTYQDSNKDECPMDISGSYTNGKDHKMTNHNHVDECNSEYMSYEESTETEQQVKSTPKSNRSKARNTSTEMHNVCSGMQAVSVEMSNVSNDHVSSLDIATGARSSFNKRSSRE